MQFSCFFLLLLKDKFNAVRRNPYSIVCTNNIHRPGLYVLMERSPSAMINREHETMCDYVTMYDV